MRSLFRLHPEGIEVRLSPVESELLSSLPELLGSVGADEDDPAERRLRVSAHPEDPEAEAVYSELIGSQLDEARTVDRSTFLASLERSGGSWVLEPDEAEAWLKVIGESRLVLAARLGIEEDGWESDPSPPTGEMAVLHYLGYLQEGLAEVLMDSFP